MCNNLNRGIILFKDKSYFIYQSSLLRPVAITVEFDPVVYNVSEDVGNAVLTLTASSAASSAYTVTVTTQDGTAVGEGCVKLHMHTL